MPDPSAHELSDLSIGSLQDLAAAAAVDLAQCPPPPPRPQGRPAPRPAPPSPGPDPNDPSALIADLQDLLEQQSEIQRALLRELDGLQRSHHESYGLLASAIGRLEARLHGNHWLWRQALPLAIAASLVTLVIERLITLAIR